MTLLLISAALSARAGEAPIVITGPEQKQIDFNLPDGGLPWYPGVSNVQVFRASRAAPALTDGKGWTYNHHLDLGVWKGRLYCAWNSCEKDEDVWPSRELYATSSDGVHWSDPQELFPMGTSAAQRMYFFHAPNGRMIALACRRDPRTHARIADSMVVREIKPDHSLGPVFHLLPTSDVKGDEGFAQACQQLLANKPFLEQADYGALLGERKMKWHDVNIWPKDEPSRADFPHRFGKAIAFYHRKDGALVAVMKWGWVLLSHDEGETWSSPVRPPTLVTGMAKLWGQRTSDGRYLLAYNPDPEKRYPLVVVTGDDGITFGDMRVIQPELPPMRYPGLYKVPGPQYVRGVSEWASDGSFKDDATFLAYSMNKEDIWLARVPVNTTSMDHTTPWNLYAPKWAPVSIDHDTLTLEDRDPADYARASRFIQPASRARITFDLTIDASNASPLYVDLLGPNQSRIARITIDSSKRVHDQRLAVKILGDCISRTCSATIENQIIPVPVMLGAKEIIGVSLQTGDRATPIDPASDRPTEPARYRVEDFSISGVSR